MQKNHPTIWALKDDRPGDYNQVFGVAEALGVPFEIKEFKFNGYVRLHTALRGASLLGIDIANSSPLHEPWPDIVIGAGRKTAPVLRYIKKQSGGKSKTIQIMWPSIPFWGFDTIVTPEHDGFKSSKRIFNSVGAPNRVTPELVAEHGKKWHEKFAHLSGQKIALLVGGNTKGGKLREKHIQILLQKVSDFARGKDVSLLVTDSRRTSKKVGEFLQKSLTLPHYFHSSKSDNENPYFGYLAEAEIIIVSGDSISMCSEACSTGKPVYIYAPADITPKKHKEFHQSLYKNGYALPLGEGTLPAKYTPLNDAKTVADFIRKTYF